MLNLLQAVPPQRYVVCWLVVGAGVSPSFQVLNSSFYALISGYVKACQIGNLVRHSLFMHDRWEAPLRSSNISLICQCIESLHVIRATYVRHSAAVADLLPHIVRHTCKSLEKVLSPLKAQLEAQLGSGRKANRSGDDLKLDMLSEVTLMLQLALPVDPVRL